MSEHSKCPHGKYYDDHCPTCEAEPSAGVRESEREAFEKTFPRPHGSLYLDEANTWVLEHGVTCKQGVMQRYRDLWDVWQAQYARIRQLEGALRFYADGSNYEKQTIRDAQRRSETLTNNVPVLADFGAIACAALSGPQTT